MFHNSSDKGNITKCLQKQIKDNISFDAILFALEDHFNIKQYNKRKQPPNKSKKSNKKGFKSLGKRHEKVEESTNIFDSIFSTE